LVVGAFAAGAACTVALSKFGPPRLPAPSATVPFSATDQYAVAPRQTGVTGANSVGAADHRAADQQGRAPDRHELPAAATTVETPTSSGAAETPAPAVKSTGTVRTVTTRPLRVVPTLGTVAAVVASVPDDKKGGDPKGSETGSVPDAQSIARTNAASVASDPALAPAKDAASGQGADAAVTSGETQLNAQPPEQARPARRQQARSKARRDRDDQMDTMRAYDYITPDGRRATVYRRVGSQNARATNNEDYAARYRPSLGGFFGLFSGDGPKW